MAGTITQAYNNIGHIRTIVFTATADDSDGSFPATVLSQKIEGRLLNLETNPGATAPTDNYDITLIDGNGHDVLEGVGADRDTADTEKVPVVFSGTGTHPVVDESDTLILTMVNNSVNSATVVVKIYYALAG